MERLRKIIGGAVSFGALLLLIANALDKGKNAIEAKDNASKIWGFLRNMFDLTPGAAIFLVVCLVGLAVALWRPAYTQFFRSLLPPTRLALPPDQQGGAIPVAGKPKNVFSNVGDNNAFQNIHVGDVNEAPAPELHEAAPTVTSNADGTNTITIPIRVVAPYPPASLLIQAWAPDIEDLAVMPQRAGTIGYGHSGTRPDHRFTTLMNPFGDYLVVVKTRASADIEIRHGFNL